MKSSFEQIGWKDLWRMARRKLFESPTEPVAKWQKIWCGCILSWEQVAPQIWPYGLSFFIFLVAALFDMPQILPGFVHAMLLAGLFSYWIYGLARIAAKWRWPDDDAIYHRIEQSSGLPHRPLTTLRDQLASAGNDSIRAEWWNHHRARLQQSLRHLTAGLPRYGFAPNDPFALRSFILLLMMIGIIHAGRDIDNRLLRAVKPEVPPASSLLSELIVSIKPPAYTGLPQINLTPAAADIVPIVKNSKIFVQYSAVTATPSFYIDGKKQKLAELSKNSYQAELQIDQAQELRADIGWQTLARWPVQMVPDNPPSIDWDGEMYATSRAAMRIGYKGKDDFGMTEVQAIISKDGETETIHLNLPVFTKSGADVRNASYHDVAYHRWAGEKVHVQIIARDAIGQTGKSPMAETVLPIRQFQDPVARAIAESRREFQFSRLTRTELAANLEQIIRSPEKFAYDARVTLGLRVACTRAAIAEDAQWDESVIDLLWDVALRIEDNGISLAEKDLRSLEQQLQDAMARGASVEEINALLDQFENAMQSYLNAMYQQMMKNGSVDLPSTDINANAIESQDVGRLLMQIRALMQSGNTAEAQKLLSKLQEIMANVRTNQGQQTESNKMAMELIQSAQELIRAQQKILDAAAANIGKPDQKLMPAWLSDAARKQVAVQKDLQSLRKKLSMTGLPMPEKFQAANRDMSSAIKHLNQPLAANYEEQNKREDILAATAGALENLRLAMQDMMQSMRQGGSGGAGQVRAGGGRYDPFGRSRPGQGVLDDPSVKVPGMQDLQRTQEILDELQRRSGDYSRPDIERDYIKRLLRRF